MTPCQTTNDFPAWIPPAVVKEIRQGLRSPAFVISLAAFPALMTFLFLLGFMRSASTNGTFISTEAVSGLYWTILCLGLITIMPMRGLQSVKPEITSRTGDLLMLTRLTPWKIVWGKWCSYMIQSLLLLLTVLPFAFVRYYYGSVNLLDDFYWLGALLVATATLTAFSIWISGLHIILRIPAMMGFLVLGIMGIVLISNVDNISSESKNWLLLIVDSYGAVICCIMFLLLASRWFAPDSDNSSRLPRLCLPLYLLPLPFYGLIPGNVMESYLALSLPMIIFLTLWELNSVLPLLPTHVRVKGPAPVAWLHNLLLLPGFSSASFFGLAFMLLLGGMIMLLQFIDGTYTNITWLYFLAVWSGATLIAMALLPLRRRLKTATPFVFLVVTGLMFSLSGILQFHELYPLAFLIPLGNFTVMDELVNIYGGHVEIVSLYCWIIGIEGLAALILLIYCGGNRRRVIAEAKRISNGEKTTESDRNA